MILLQLYFSLKKQDKSKEWVMPVTAYVAR